MGDIAPEVNVLEPAFHPEQRFGELAAEEERDAVAHPGDRRQVVEGLPAGSERQVHLRVGQGDPPEGFRDVPGFVDYYLLRAADGGASVTICQDQAGAQEPTRRAAAWVRENVPAAAGSPPEVTEGEVLYRIQP